MGRISMIDPQTAPENVQEVIRRHLAGGHQLTNEKRTLLHNVNAFLAIEEASYTLDRDLQERIGKLDADLFASSGPFGFQADKKAGAPDALCP